MSNAATWQITPATREETQILDDKIFTFNQQQVPFTQNPTPILLNYVIKDQNTIIAGIDAFLYHWNILFIDVLFVEEAYRGQDLGSALLAHTENIALQLGSTLAHVDTFDFQAKDFYLKQGYTVFGTLQDCPPGHERYYLKKVLKTP